MGLAMATNLQKHLATKSTLSSLLYSNRTMTRGDPLKVLGAAPETSFSKLVSQCGIIFTMVSPTHGFWLELVNYCTKEG
jgi:3-hydroxyisobutyrate dehydrogenase-like beta-hydroxyacid dehydrogenase